MKFLRYIVLIIIILSLSILHTPSARIYKANFIEFYDHKGNLIDCQIKGRKSKYIYLNELNDYTINAFISYEDNNFYNHKGFDLLSIIKSLFINLVNKEYTRGGSTITQQYARTLFLNNKKSLIRKFKEAYYTIKLEQKYSKEEILEGYLNNIYLGHGCYGIESASLYYFNKSSINLTLEESALLASLASSPSKGSPFNNFDIAMKRKNLVLKKMLKDNYISIQEYNNAIKKSIILNNAVSIESNLNYYLDQVKKEIDSLNLNRGLKVYTNIDLELYKKINNIVSKYQNNDYEICLVVLENNSNKVLVNLGGFNYSKSSFNRALYSSRQIGSTIKTFLYSLAIENGISTNTKLLSKPTTFNIKNYGEYSPKNSNNNYAYDYITMNEAYAVSDNIYASKMLLFLGSNNFFDYLKKFNLKCDIVVPSIALGTCENTLFDLTKAYSVFPNNGFYQQYYFINKILDSYNNLLYSSGNNIKHIINKSSNEKIKRLMHLPFIKNNYYAKSTLEDYNIKNFYGKTGSTKSDSYVVASNDNYTIGIRVGVDNIDTNFHNYSTSKNILKEISLII